MTAKAPVVVIDPTKLNRLHRVTRFEVIDETGRVFHMPSRRRLVVAGRRAHPEGVPEAREQ
jgi:hypothetical protein